MEPPDVGPYKIGCSRVVYDRSLMQLAGGAAVCANGDLVVYYNRHTDAMVRNEAHFLRSVDGGPSWEATALPISSRHEEGAVHVATGMIVLEDGTVLLPFADYRSGRGADDEHPRQLKGRRRSATVHVAVSTDHAHHWDRIVDIDLPHAFAYPFGRIVHALGGALCLPIRVADGTGHNGPGDGSTSGFVVSRDGGNTWGDFRAIVPAPNPLACVETTIARCADGSLLALHRNPEAQMLASRSHDDGETWSAPEPTPLHGECGCLIRDPAGRMVAAYRSHRKAPRDVPMGLLMAVSEDNGKTWSAETPLPDPKGRRHEFSHETGMPDIVVLPDNRLGVIYYSFDPGLPYRHPVNDSAWDRVWFFWKRYLAMAVLEEK